MNNAPLGKKQQTVLDTILRMVSQNAPTVALTVTLNVKRIEQRHGVNLSYEDKDAQAHTCNKILTDIFGSHVTYIMVSEYTQDGIWHSHGILFKISEKWLRDGYSKIRRSLGFIKVKTNIDSKWYDYMIKDSCDHVIVNDDYDDAKPIPRVMLSKHLKQNCSYYKQTIEKEFTEDDFQSYKIAKAKKHVMAAARMFRKCKKIKKKIKKCKNAIII